MKQIETLLPKSKFDFSQMEKLNMLSDEEIEPILPELLAWMKDMNWPVAKEMPELLSRHQAVLIPCIIEALQPEQWECDWKYYIISCLLPLLEEEYLDKLKPCLERIAKNPTQAEISEEADRAAQDFLKMDIKQGK